MLRFLLLACLVTCSLGIARLPRRPHLDGKIVGGQAVNIEDFPYQLSLEYGGSHRCGGSIISPNWVVTSATCVDGVSASNVQFRAGSSIRGTGGTLHQASQIILHIYYDYYTLNYDVAVVRVSTAFVYGSGVQPIALGRVEPENEELSVVSGWGTLSSDSSALPSQLQAAEVYISDKVACDNVYMAYGGITEHMICAMAPGGGKDACGGDTGGPLVIRNNQVGIVSWGVGCGETNYPGVYTNVATVRGWVTEQTGVA